MNTFHRACTFIILSVLVLIVLSPLFRSGFLATDDGDWMIIRLSAFYQSLRDGQFPVRFLGRLNNSYGYPVANFLYPGFLYVGSFLHILGFTFIESVKIILIGSIAGSVYFLYSLLRKFYTKTASLAGTVSFILSPYILFDLYKRGSVGEIFAFLPAILCFYCIEYNHKVVFTFTTALLILSHNTLALFFLPLIVLYIIYTKNYSYLHSLVIGIGLASFFWIPALWERRYIVFNSVEISEPKNYFLLKVPWQIGFIGVWFAAIAGRFQKSSHNLRHSLFIVIFLASLFMSSSISSFLWSNSLLIKLVQFPYRFLALSTLAGSWLIALYIQNLRIKIFFLLFLTVIWTYTLYSAIITVDFNSHDEAFYVTNEATTTVADEYMPRWVNEKSLHRADKRFTIITGSGEIIKESATSKNLEAFVEMDDAGVIQVNTMYYPGWGILVDNMSVDIDYTNPYGAMRVHVPKGSHHIQGEFHETAVRLLSDCISVLSLLTIIWLQVRSSFAHQKISRKKLLS